MRNIPLPTPPAPLLSEIFQLVLNVNRARNVGAVLRVAGGWVRDSLLGITAHDVDIAIETPNACGGETITGAIFAKHIAEFQLDNAMEGSKISVVRTNPEKSKHIETAQMTLCGIPVEFCHLRADDYSADSRVPTVRPGTPLEDAERRDFTVNALFYNLHTSLIEDFVGGLVDMDNCVLRCPLEPRRTFLDDPLRLLRAIRFSGQLGFSLDPSILSCVSECPEIVEALQHKVSRERVGIELQKMFSGRRPSLCVELLHRTHLLYTNVLVEAYYFQGTSLDSADVKLAAPGKGNPIPNKVELMLPSPPLVSASLPYGTLSPETQRWNDVSSEILRNFAELHDPLMQSIKDDRPAIKLYASMFLLVLPVLSSKSVSPTTGEIVNCGSAEATRRCRMDALVVHSLKLPSKCANVVCRMIDAAVLMQPFVPEILSVSEAHRSNAATTSNDGQIFVGPCREAIWNCLRALKDDSAFHDIVLNFLILRHMGATSNALNMLQAVRAALYACTGGRLISSPSCPPLIDGRKLGEILQLRNKQIGKALSAMSLYVLHRPDATADEVVGYLRTLDFPA